MCTLNRLCWLVLTALAIATTGVCMASTELNEATEAELDSINGLGPSSTARILKAREQGPFKDWADFLRRVKGFKAKSAAHLSEGGLTVNGAPFEASKDAKTKSTP